MKHICLYKFKKYQQITFKTKKKLLILNKKHLNFLFQEYVKS
jgi:hypothetical protein